MSINAAAPANSLPATQTEVERIASLEERSKHAATKAELHRALLTLFIALITVLSGLLGGVIVHLHSITLNEIAEMRTVMYQLLQQFSGG